MRRRRIQNVLRKEWRVIFTDVNNALLVTLLPLLIVAQVIGYIWLIDHFGSEALLSNELFRTAIARLQQALTAVATLTAVDKLRMLLLSQFNFFILFIPTMIAMNFAAFSIVEEKLSRSLEPLLATPVRTWELLLGKALAGALPALVITWACAGVFIVIVVRLGWGSLVNLVLTPGWFMSLFLLTPAITVLSFMLGIIGSSRARDAKSAQNIALVVILPVLGLIGVQVTGVVWFTPVLTLALALGIVLLDILVLRIAVGLFQRESIVTRWQ